MWVRAVQLVVSCAVLGVGVALLLAPALGSDGFSTLINGLALALDAPFLAVNVAVGVVLILLAWAKGRRPGLGTVVQPVVTGAVVTVALATVPDPVGLVARAGLFLLGFAVVAVGVAGYLGSDTGAGPAEALSTAYDPPFPFRWSYSVFQGRARCWAGCSEPPSGPAPWRWWCCSDLRWTCSGACSPDCGWSRPEPTRWLAPGSRTEGRRRSVLPRRQIPGFTVPPGRR